MSFDRHIHLGPYVRCTYRKATREDTLIGCMNKACKKHPKKDAADVEGKFCQACGGPVGKVKITVEDFTHPYDVVEDELSEIEANEPNANVLEPHKRSKFLYLCANVARKGDPRPHLDSESEQHLDLSDVDTAAEIAWFTKAFAKELKKLESAYDNVEVKWGFHQYFY